MPRPERIPVAAKGPQVYHLEELAERVGDVELPLLGLDEVDSDEHDGRLEVWRRQRRGLCELSGVGVRWLGRQHEVRAAGRLALEREGGFPLSLAPLELPPSPPPLPERESPQARDEA